MEKQNNGWIHRKSRLPSAEDGDSTGKVIVWHIYQGAMLTRWDDYTKNPFNVSWMRISDWTTTPWISATETMLTKEDADTLNCVLARNKGGDISITGFHQFTCNNDLTHWMKLPVPPSDYRELRRMQ